MATQSLFVPAPDAKRVVEMAAAPALPVVARALAGAIVSQVPVHHGVAKAHYKAAPSGTFLAGAEPEGRVWITSSRWHFLEYGTAHNPPYRPVLNGARVLGLRYEPTLPPVVPLLPDAEQLVSAFLRRQPSVTAMVGDRVYTAFPAQAGSAPLAIVQLIASDAPLSQPLVIDNVRLQIDTYGGNKRDAQLLMATIRACLCALEGSVQPEGVCAGVRFGSRQYLPDETFTPPRPRYISDVVITMRATVAPVSRQAATPVAT